MRVRVEVEHIKIQGEGLVAVGDREVALAAIIYGGRANTAQDDEDTGPEPYSVQVFI